MKNNQVPMLSITLISFFATFILGGGFLIVGLKVPDMLICKIIGCVVLSLSLLFLGVIIRTILILIRRRMLYRNSNAHTTIAHLIDYDQVTEVMVGVGKNKGTYKYYEIVYEYVDEKGITRECKPILEYLECDVLKLAKMKTFNIKCKGKLSCIFEDFGEGRKVY